MEESEIELRKRIDLHYDKRSYSHVRNYVEFYFHACFYEIFNIKDSSWETDFCGDEIPEIMDYLEIKVDKIYYTDGSFFHQNNNVEVFHSDKDEQVFAYFDFWKDPTDQNDMFMLGISCTKEQELIIHPKLLNIYKKLQTSSPFTFDIRNNQLYNKVFSSYEFFYDGKYNKNKRQLNHHNLEK